jgi:hypothetical protein
MLSTQDEWPSGKYLAAALRIGHRMRLRALLLIGIGLGAGALGYALSTRRHRYLARFGLALTLASFAVGTAARFGGDVAAALPGSPTVAELTRGLWPVFVEPLARRMLVLGAIGLVLVAAATSFLEKIDLAAAARGTWRRISGRPRRPALSLLRGAALVAFGGLVALHPAGALEILVVALGAALFFVGIQELFALVVRARPVAEAVAAGRRRPLARLALAIVLPVILIGAGVIWLQRDQAEAVAPPVSDACNGHPELCDRRLDQVAFAATHNSMAAADVPDWMFPNQEKGIRAQLEDGVRGFLVDIHYGIPVGDRVKTLLENEKAAMEKYEATLGTEGVEAAMRIRNRLVGETTGERDVYLGHGFCELGAMPFVTALEAVREFLVANPAEVILIVIQDEGVAPKDVAACFERSGLDQFLYRGPAARPWPTLREMIARDERVVVFAENDVEGVPWYHRAFDVFQETPYRFNDPSEFSNQPNRGGKSGSLLLMNHWIETTPAPKPTNAEVVNAFDLLYARAKACRRARGMIPTLVAVDFYATGDLVRVVDALNGVADASGAPAP